MRNGQVITRCGGAAGGGPQSAEAAALFVTPKPVPAPPAPKQVGPDASGHVPASSNPLGPLAAPQKFPLAFRSYVATPPKLKSTA